MRLKYLLGVSSALCLGVTLARAQETNEVQLLRQQMQQMQQNFERALHDQQHQIEVLETEVGMMGKPPAAGAATNAAVSPEELERLNAKVDAVVEAQTKTLPGEFNPAIGVVGETVFAYHSRASDATGSARPGGFDVWQRSVELNMAASVDPFAKGWLVANASADSASGEATFGIEEAALQTTSLPGNLTLTAGRFFGEFGKLSNIHDHELPFVNRPLALERYVGGESRTDGLQVNWLPPVDHYISLSLGVGDQLGGDIGPNDPGKFRAFRELNFWGRLSTYFDLTPNWQLEAGVSSLWNPHTESLGGVMGEPGGSTATERARRLAGVDFKVSYVPLQDNQFRSFTWGTELLYSDNSYLFDPDGSFATNVLTGDEYTRSVGAFGGYTYLSYKWSRQWSGGFLFDCVQNAENRSAQTYAYSPFITFALSHWDQLRLEYTHTEPNAATGYRPDDAIYLQWAWIIGAHSHGWTQR
jgi:hypothetical protein